MSWFNIKDGIISIKDPRLLNSEAIKPLMTLKYNKQKGDIDGRKKIRAVKELMFLYFMTEYEEIYTVEEHERIPNALCNAGLPEDYKISPELEVALVFVEKETRNLSMIALKDASDNLYSLLKRFKIVNNQLDKRLDLLVANADENQLIDDSDLDIIIKQSDKSASLVNKFNQMIKNLEEVKESLKKEQDESDQGLSLLEQGILDI